MITQVGGFFKPPTFICYNKPMKKIIATLVLALTTLTASYAQYYDNDPVGTVYEYEMSNKLMGTSTITQTLKKVEGNVITSDSRRTSVAGGRHE